MDQKFNITSDTILLVDRTIEFWDAMKFNDNNKYLNMLACSVAKA